MFRAGCGGARQQVLKGPAGSTEEFSSQRDVRFQRIARKPPLARDSLERNQKSGYCSI
jgi:hypothetical protein